MDDYYKEIDTDVVEINHEKVVKKQNINEEWIKKEKLTIMKTKEDR